MAYTYMWLKDGREVSGRTSSTYSFSPLLAVHSGRYSCRVSVGSLTVTSESVDITVVGKSGMIIHEYHSHIYELVMYTFNNQMMILLNHPWYICSIFRYVVNYR